MTEYPRGVYHIYMIPDIKKRSLHRSRIIQGQIKGLEKMIENEEYCIDILTQSLAIQKSLKSLNKLILENHLKTHVPEQMKEGSEEKTVEELLNIYNLSEVKA